MEIFKLESDIRVLCIRAKSFPEGIAEAHERLRALFQPNDQRIYFGLSRPERGPIVYKAAAEEKHIHEREALECESSIVQKGEYIFITLNDYASHPGAINRIFKELISHPGIDPEGYCLEWYLPGNAVRCMVRLKD